MNQPGITKPDAPFSFAGGLLLFILILFISSAPVIAEQLNKPERIAFRVLSRSRTWQSIYTSTSASRWEATDGSAAEHVSLKQTNSGIQVVLEPIGSATREAYFNDDVVTTDVFQLSTEVSIPTDCYSGLVFRGNEQGEYYLFLVNSVSYTAEILHRQDNLDLPRKAIIPNTPIPTSVGEPRTITVLGDGQSYLFYINNVFVNGMKDSRLKGDRVGLEVFT